MARGPRKTRAGRKNSAASNAKTPFTAMPTMRNGKVSSQTIGNSTTASKANGQHKINKMHQRKKAAIRDLPTRLRTRSARSFLEVGGILAQAQAFCNGDRHIGVEGHMRVFDRRTAHAAEGVNERKGATFGKRQAQTQGHDGIDGQRGIDTLEQSVDALAGHGGDERGPSFGGAVQAALEGFALLGGEQVHFVEHAKFGAVGDAELLEDFVDFGIEFLMMRVGNITDVQN